MPSLEQDLYSMLSQNADVLTALGGKNTLWKSAIPKGKETQLPAVVMQNVYTATPYTADGALNARKKRIQFDSYSSDRNHDRGSLRHASRISFRISPAHSATPLSRPASSPRRWICPKSPAPVDTSSGDCSSRISLLRLGIPQPVSPTLPAPPTGANAGYIEGIPVSPSAPADGQALVYDAASGEWKPETVTGSGSGGTIILNRLRNFLTYVYHATNKARIDRRSSLLGTAGRTVLCDGRPTLYIGTGTGIEQLTNLVSLTVKTRTFKA